MLVLSYILCEIQGSRKWDPRDLVGLAKTYLVGQKEFSTHESLDITQSRLDKLTADWTNSQQIGQTVQEMGQPVLEIGQNIT